MSTNTNNETMQTVTRRVDAAVIGSGFAGLSAAYEAAKLGKRVLLIDKMPNPGGNSVMNAGQIAAVGSPNQEKAGIKDSVELMKQDMLDAGVSLNHPNLLEKMISQSWDTVKWTMTEFGIQYRDRLTQMGGHSVPRTLSTMNHSGRDIIDPMLSKIQYMPNVKLEMKTKFERFILEKNDENGQDEVAGIEVSHNGVTQDVICDKGVILASGGFSADIPFRKIQVPTFGEKVMSTNQPGATAEVIKESLKISALPVQLSHIQLGPWTSPDESGFGLAPFFCIGAGFPYGIIIDPDTSTRFVNELGNRYERSMAILKMCHPVVCMTDSEGAKHSLEKDLTKLEPTLKAHNSIEEVAEEYGMDPIVLRETIDKYNASVAMGEDEDFGKLLREDAAPLVKFPFYSVRLWPKVHHCMGGLHINSDAQVMHVDGYPIKGLFAAGEVTGGVHGGDRLGSCATLDCIAFGRIAGKNVATFNKKKEGDLHNVAT
ncbi:fumarate reductase flavoprotein subunit [Skeletonema marinoi]|uniref:Fumarate reductase flavoprotein subunit n=1 Tax=Skeletonema marinoi TaxID=267567 RepID=A0AAD8Y853_9STRA|nr:fumarate reductase flavoprotein subunit [Skeletonema marinoi]